MGVGGSVYKCTSLHVVQWDSSEVCSVIPERVPNQVEPQCL